MLAVVDETTHEFKEGIAYVVGAAVLIADEDAAHAALLEVVGGRQRPFHWHREGPTARAAAVQALLDLGAVSHICIHFPTGRRRQEEARAKALADVVPRLLDDGASHLLIESRGERQDNRDRATILDLLNARGTPAAIEYARRPKTEPVLWIADALCGAVRETLIESEHAHYFATLKAANVARDPIYIKSETCVSPGSRPSRQRLSSGWPSGACGCWQGSVPRSCRKYRRGCRLCQLPTGSEREPVHPDGAGGKRGCPVERLPHHHAGIEHGARVLVDPDRPLHDLKMPVRVHVDEILVAQEHRLRRPERVGELLQAIHDDPSNAGASVVGAHDQRAVANHLRGTAALELDGDEIATADGDQRVALVAHADVVALRLKLEPLDRLAERRRLGTDDLPELAQRQAPELNHAQRHRTSFLSTRAQPPDGIARHRGYRDPGAARSRGVHLSRRLSRRSLRTFPSVWQPGQ